MLTGYASITNIHAYLWLRPDIYSLDVYEITHVNHFRNISWMFLFLQLLSRQINLAIGLNGQLLATHIIQACGLDLVFIV
jgi:hypothetical protein